MMTRLPVAFVCAAIVASCAVFLLAERHHPFALKPIDPRIGQAVFESQCAACHAVSPDSIGGLGPSLATIGRDAAGRVNNLSSEEYLAQSILEPNAYVASGTQGVMSAGIGAALRDEEIRALIGYLMGFGGIPDAGTIASLKLPRPSSTTSGGRETDHTPRWQELAYGRKLFTEQLGCAACHGILDIPGSDSLAPSLKRAALLDEAYLLQSIYEPSAVITRTYQYATINTDDGRQLNGRVLQRNDAKTELLVGLPGDPRNVTLPADQIASIKLETGSRMPAFQLSERDERALISFLRFLDAAS